MKKSLIALAVAGALTAPMVAQADATLYGSLRVKVVDADGSKLDVANNSSRLGIKGSSDLFSGAKAIFQWEQALDTDSGALSGGRLAYIGATGDFGTVTMGRQWTPHYNWTGGVTDIGDNGTTGGTQSILRLGNTVAYITPNMGGFQAAAVIIADETSAAATTEVTATCTASATVTCAGTGPFVKTTAASSDSEDLDAYNLAATYNAGGLGLGVSYVGFETADDADIVAVAASYSVDALYIAARYEQTERGASDDLDTFEVSGSYSMGNTTLVGQFLDYGESTASVDQGNALVMEVQQKLGKKARVFAAYTSASDDAATTGKAQDTVEVGYRVDF